MRVRVPEVGRPIVCNMPIRREWDVTVRGRIETVTDRVEFPGLFRAALLEEDQITIVRFDQPTLPHTTLVIVRVSAKSEKAAEQEVRDLVLRIYLTIARQMVVDSNFGLTLSTSANPSDRRRLLTLHGRWTRLLETLQRR